MNGRETMGSYTGDLKCNLKSVRMTDKVYNYIMTADGEGFNQKFEKLVVYFMETEEEKRVELEILDKQIQKRRQELARLERGKQLMDNVLNSLQELQNTFTGELFHKSYTNIALMIRENEFIAKEELVKKIYRLNELTGKENTMKDLYKAYKEQLYNEYPEKQGLVNDIVSAFQSQEQEISDIIMEPE